MLAFHIVIFHIHFLLMPICSCSLYWLCDCLVLVRVIPGLKGKLLNGCLRLRWWFPPTEYLLDISVDIVEYQDHLYGWVLGTSQKSLLHFECKRLVVLTSRIIQIQHQEKKNNKIAIFFGSDGIPKWLLSCQTQTERDYEQDPFLCWWEKPCIFLKSNPYPA